MSISRNKLYGIILTACFAGAVWAWLQSSNSMQANKGLNVCFLKNIFNIPCPSCGATRSLLLLINGQVAEALYLNPIGFIIATIIFIAPIWVLYDIVFKEKSFLMFYIKLESGIKKPGVAITLIVFILINWIWNIKKGI